MKKILIVCTLLLAPAAAAPGKAAAPEFAALLPADTLMAVAFDDLGGMERVMRDPVAKRRALKIYLDSGWPEDNYEATLAMAVALAGRGFLFGRDFIHHAFPLEQHGEARWGGRCHLPLQFFAGYPRQLSTAVRAARTRAGE